MRSADYLMTGNGLHPRQRDQITRQSKVFQLRRRQPFCAESNRLWPAFTTQLKRGTGHQFVHLLEA